MDLWLNRIQRNINYIDLRVLDTGLVTHKADVNNLSDWSVRKEVINQHRNSTLNADEQDFLLIQFFKYLRQFRKKGHLVSLKGVDSKLLHNVANRNHDYLEATINIRISVLNT
jgi:hypothetical protein